MSNSRKYSSVVIDGYERAASRAMLYPVGFKKEDFKKPQVGIASTWSMVTPCNMHINDLASEAEKGSTVLVVKVLFLTLLPYLMVFQWDLKG